MNSLIVRLTINIRTKPVRAYFYLLFHHAIFIACMGLFGLAAYAIQQRMREIGVGKVLGATFSIIVSLLSKECVKLILLSVLIAFPVAWYRMKQWLQGFTCRVEFVLVDFCPGSFEILSHRDGDPE